MKGVIVADLVQMLLLLVTAIGVLVAIHTLRSQTRNSRIEKISDVIMECTRRYDGILRLARDLDASVKQRETTRSQAASTYFHAYWNLQWDQWNCARLGLLPLGLLAIWYSERIDSLTMNQAYFGVTFDDGWRTFGRQHLKRDPAFVEFVDAVWMLAGAVGADTTRQINALLEDSYRNFRSTRRSIVRRSMAW